MARSTKRRKRILLIVGAIALVAGLGGGAYALRQRQRDREAELGRDAGRAAFAAGNYPAALDGMGLYLGRLGANGATAADYLLVARARRRIPLPNDKHLISAIRSVQRAIELEPSNTEAKAELLSLFMETGMNTEALDLVDLMIAAAPGDVALLRTKCDLLEGHRQFAKALAVSKQINQTAPDDFEGFARTMRLLVASRSSLGEVDTWLASVVAAHPGDGRFDLLRASVCARRLDEANAKICLDRAMAAGLTSKDVSFVRLLVVELDSANRFADSLRVLEAADVARDPVLSRELVRRLWYAGRLQDVAARTQRISAGEIRTDPEMLALHALALISTGRPADAEPFRKELSARGDPVGAAWTAFVASLAGDPATGSAAALAAAVEAVPDSAFLRQALGDAYASIGETDLALEAWTAAGARSGAWALPLRRIADMLIATGREHLAPAMARAALARSPNDLAVVTTYIRANSAVSGDLDAKQVAALIDAVTAIEAAAPDQADKTLPVYVDLLVRVDKKAAETRLAAVLTAAPPPSEQTLMRLAAIAARSGIPLESQLLETSEKAHGVTPQLAFAMALSRARAGGASAGLRVIDEMRGRAAETTTSLDWDLVRASVLDAFRAPEAGAAWTKLADAQPDALSAQLGALASQSVWNDRESVARIIDRVRKLTGEQAITWRIARSRWLLGGPEASEAEIAEAAQILSDVTKAAPRSVSARLLLAQAFEKLRNLAGAEEQLRIAAELGPDNIWLALEVARLAQRQGRPEVARRQLDRVIDSPDLAPEQVERAAYLLSVQGDPRRSADLLEPLMAHSQVRRDAVLLLAQLYSKLGETDRAIALCERLAGTPDPEVIGLSADLSAKIGKPAEAEAMLARLDGIELTPGDRELTRARYAASWGPPGAAKEWFEKATLAAPDRADAWTARLSHAIATGDAAALGSVLDDPKAARVDAVRFMAGIRPLASAAIRDERLRTLLLATIDDEANRPSLVEAIRLISADPAEGGDPIATARAVRTLADSRVRVLALQLVAADLCAETGELNLACDIAKRAMSEFPNSSSAARQSAEMLARSGRWDEALTAAGQWRARAAHRDLAADVFIADTMLRSGHPANAASELEPHVRAALARPEENEALILTWAVALVRSGRVARVTDALSDLSRKSSRWRIVAARVPADRLGDGKSASEWIRACASTIPPDDVPANIQLARAWGSAWETYREPQCMEQAQRVIDRITSRPDAPAEAFLVAGTLAQMRDDAAAARRDYLAALQRDPGFSAARNNLAVVLADSGDWKAAVEEATKATKAEPGNANCLDTLAYAFRKGGEFERASTSLEQAIHLEPRNPAWLVSLAETQAESGNADGLRRTLAKVDDLASSGPGLPDALRRRLDRVRTKPR